MRKILLFKMFVLIAIANIFAMDIDPTKDRLTEVYSKADRLSRKIYETSDQLKNILSDYQTYNVTEYEIERSIRTLNGLHENSIYLESQETINSAAVMLPSNLPLYSLVTFALIPSLQAKSVYVRPNSNLQECNIISRIYDVLNLDELFPGIKIVNTDHAGFKKHIREADLVVFTGNPKNAENLANEMNNNSLLIVNGAGHNPVIVTDSADIQAAVDKTLHLKSFNGGQDCAGPDAILVHTSVAKQFIEKFEEKFSSLKTGSFKDPETIIGPINRLSELQKFARIFHKNRGDIISGGTIDFKNNIVFPTTIVRDIELKPNYEEIFGPIAFIHPYKTDEDLAYYFHDSDGRYNAQRMYATLFGQSEYILSRDDTLNPNGQEKVGIVLHNKTIHDIEIGYKEYGGNSLAASHIIRKTPQGRQKRAMPILIPELVSEYLLNGKDAPLKQAVHEATEQCAGSHPTKRTKEINQIIKKFKAITSQNFSENLIFAFIFGSAAKNKLRFGGQDSSDLDTFICIKKEDNTAVNKYLEQLATLHEEFGLKVDTRYPCEIMTLEMLHQKINALDEIVISVDEQIKGAKFDQMFWAQVLTDKKAGFFGDHTTMMRLITASEPLILKWKNQILEQLEKKDHLPEHILQTFEGLSKNEIIAKLSNYSPHEVVYLALIYDDGEKMKKKPTT